MFLIDRQAHLHHVSASFLILDLWRPTVWVAAIYPLVRAHRSGGWANIGVMNRGAVRVVQIFLKLGSLRLAFRKLPLTPKTSGGIVAECFWNIVFCWVWQGSQIDGVQARVRISPAQPDVAHTPENQFIHGREIRTRCGSIRAPMPWTMITDAWSRKDKRPTGTI